MATHSEVGVAGMTIVMHGNSGSLEYVLVGFEQCSVVGWLWPVEGRLSVVGLEFGPAPLDPEETRSELDRRADLLQQVYMASSPRALSRSSVRAFPFGAVVELRNGGAAAYGGSRRPTAPVAELSPAEVRLLEPLGDACLYVEAIQRGERVPASAISSARGISLRTAQGRVARARRLGLLTASRPGVAGGDLTSTAHALAQKIKRTGGKD